MIVGLRRPYWRGELLRARRRWSFALHGAADSRESQANRPRLVSRNRESIMRSSLCPSLARFYDVYLVLNNRIVDRIFHERATVRHAPQPLEIRFVFGEEKFFCVFAMEFVTAKPIMSSFDHCERGFSQTRLARIAAPAPGIAEPNRGQEMQGRRLGTAIRSGCANQNIFWSCLGIRDLNVEVAILRQSVGVPELEFWFRS